MATEDKTKVVKKYVCSTCRGTGEVTCSKCGGKGERKCPRCGGTGHACPVCLRGYVEKTRWINCERCSGTGYQDGGYKCGKCSGRGQVKETYKVLCPNCHGAYKDVDHVCDKCGGKKKISCAKHEECPSCGGKGKWSEVHDKASKCNLRLFRAFSMAFGFSGLQYFYVGRWCLFLLQFATFALLAAVALFWDPNGVIATYAARFCKSGSDAESVKLQIELFLGFLLVLNLLVGMFAIKRDRQGGLLTDDYKRGWFWLFFLVFGITGAHLAYTKERLLLGVHLLWIAVPTVLGIISVAGEGLSRCVVIIIVMFVFTIVEAIVAKIVNAMFDTHFLDKDK